MRWRAKWSHVAIALGLIAALAFAAPGFSLDKGTNKAIKKAVKKEVAKQIGNATGPPGANGVNGLNGANGTARAYARVRSHAFFDCTGGCTFDRSKGVTSVTRVATGSYCVTAPGLSPANTTAAVTVDVSLTAVPEGNASAMIRSDSPCPAGRFQVITERQPEVTVDAGGGTNNASVAGNAQASDLVSFTIVIP